MYIYYHRKFFLFSSIFFLILSIFFNQQLEYAIILASIGISLLVCFFVAAFKYTDPKKAYILRLNEILKNYDSILVEVKNLPNVNNKNMILVENIGELIDAQIELKKPIYFYREEKDCIFLLLDMDIVCFYVFKLNNDVVSSIDYFFEISKKYIA